MTNSKNTKRALLTSALSVVLCIAMLVGATFAWFTDSVTSSGNIIKSGTLKISAVWQDTDAQAAGEGYTIPGFARAETIKFSDTETDINKENAIISEQLWEPGAVGAKLITVRNDGNLAAKIKLLFSVKDEGLQNALWFDFVQIKDGAVVGQFTKREMSAIAALGEAMEFPLMPKDTAGDSLSFILLYGMKEEAGNEYQGKGFAADVTILATQYAHEADSFDEQYDKDAPYPVIIPAGTTNLKDFISKVEENGTILLSDNVTLDAKDGAYFRDNTKAVFDLNSKTLTTNPAGLENPITVTGTYENSDMQIQNGSVVVPTGMWRAITAAGSSNLQIKDMVLFGGKDGCVTSFQNATVSIADTTISTDTGGCLRADQGGTLNVYSGNYQQGGKATAANFYNSLVMASNMGTVNVYDGYYEGTTYGVYVFNSGGTINVYGGTFQADTVLKADYNKGASTINVYGGSFTGKLSIVPQATLYIEAGVFAGTGLTLDEFNAYVAQGSTVTESNGVFTVTKGN